jgi:cell division control protein 24
LERTRESTDPVTELWELFSLGVSLCYIFDQLAAEEGFAKINNSEFNQEDVANYERSEKRAIALFVMHISMVKVKQSIPGCEPFTVTELWKRSSIDGLIKV